MPRGIDGCSKFRFLISIVIPYIKPAMLVLSDDISRILEQLPVAITNPQQGRQVHAPIALIRFSAGWETLQRNRSDDGGAFFSIAPSLIIFIVFHRYLMKEFPGIAWKGVDIMSGIKKCFRKTEGEFWNTLERYFVLILGLLFLSLCFGGSVLPIDIDISAFEENRSQ